MAKKKPTVVDVIRKALPLVSQSKTWTQGALARDCFGSPLSVPWDARAVRWCAEGALQKVAFDLTGGAKAAAATLAKAVIVELTRDSTALPVHFVNDYDGREAVVALFEKALAA